MPLTATPKRDARVRARMADDCRRQAELLWSEFENYGAEFWPGEQQTLKYLIRGLRTLADQIERNG